MNIAKKKEKKSGELPVERVYVIVQLSNTVFLEYHLQNKIKDAI